MLITGPGIYDKIPMLAYHGEECCPAPSISSSGLRTLALCPVKYWWHSPLNPNRPAREDSRAFAVGKAAHDTVLFGALPDDLYHVLPDGYDRRLKKWDADRALEELARGEGKTIVRHDDLQTVNAMAAALRGHPFAGKLFERGKSEQTIAWQDRETGVWLRCRPDFLPDARLIVPDLKTCISAHPEDCRKAVSNYGYHMSASLYLDGIEAVTGERPEHFCLVFVEKSEPHPITVVTPDAEAMGWAAKENRRAIRLFADCLFADRWPGYAEEPVVLGLSGWAINELRARDERGDFNEGEAA